MPQTRKFKHPTAFKLEVIARMESGARKAVLAEKRGVVRRLLYPRHDSWEASGVEGLNCKHGP